MPTPTSERPDPSKRDEPTGVAGDETAGVNYAAPSIEKTNRLAEVTGAGAMTGPV